jgi:hypothetical protein
VHADSDVVLLRPFSAVSVVDRGGRVRLYARPDYIDEALSDHVRWHRSGEKLLGIGPAGLPLPDFISSLVPWKRQNAVALLEHIERTTTDLHGILDGFDDTHRPQSSETPPAAASGGVSKEATPGEGRRRELVTLRPSHAVLRSGARFLRCAPDGDPGVWITVWWPDCTGHVSKSQVAQSSDPGYALLHMASPIRHAVHPPVHPDGGGRSRRSQT